MCELRHTSLVVQKMQGRAEVSRLADAKAASRGMQRPTSAYEPGSSSLDFRNYSRALPHFQVIVRIDEQRLLERRFADQ